MAPASTTTIGGKLISIDSGMQAPEVVGKCRNGGRLKFAIQG
jgi:hypothetical protein